MPKGNPAGYKKQNKKHVPTKAEARYNKEVAKTKKRKKK